MNSNMIDSFQEHILLLLNSISYPRVIFTHDTYSVIGANENALQFFQIHQREENFLQLNKLIVDEYEFNDITDHIDYDGFLADYEVRIRTPKGTQRWTILSCTKLIIDGEELLVTDFYDITERKLSESALKYQQNLLHTLFKTIPYAISFRDSNGMYQNCNDAFCKLISRRKEEVLGSSLESLHVDTNIVKIFKKEMAVFYEKTQMQRYETLRFSPNRKQYFDIVSVPVIDESNAVQGVVTMIMDITKRRSAEIALQHKHKELKDAYKKLDLAARTDPLTKLSNRRDMLERINQEKIRFDRNKRTFSLVLGDIDFFKKFNDSYGHDCGDFVLTAIAATIKENLRRQDIVARWGGEEFLLLLPETEISGAYILTEKIRKSVEEALFRFNALELQVTMSFGVAEFSQSDSIDSCIKHADEKLYQAKEAGRNQVMK